MDEAISDKEKYSFRPDMDKIIEDVALILNISVDSILLSERGRRNIPRWVAMYLCQSVRSTGFMKKPLFSRAFDRRLRDPVILPSTTLAAPGWWVSFRF